MDARSRAHDRLGSMTSNVFAENRRLAALHSHRRRPRAADQRANMKMNTLKTSSNDRLVPYLWRIKAQFCH
jgi:hypothetical protein